MTEEALPFTVSVAFAHTAEVQAWRMAATREERALVEQALHNLFNFGHLAAFSVRLDDGILAPLGLIDHLGSRLGQSTVHACAAGLGSLIGSLPSFLMPVWAFDHIVDDTPAATGRLLGVDLELLATRSHDEEQGAHLPGRIGRWLIHARPMF